MRSLALLLLGGLLLIVYGLVRAQDKEPANLLANGDFARDGDSWDLPTENATTSFVDAQAGPFRRALRLTLNPVPGEPAWNVALRQTVGTAIKKDQPLTLKLWLRSPSNNKIGVFLEEAEAPYAKSLAQELTLAPEWQEYEVAGAGKADFKADGARVVFHLGYGAGIVEIAGVRLFDPTGTPVAARTSATPDQPQSLLENGDFAAPPDAGAWPGWGRIGVPPGNAGPLQAEVVDVDPAQTGGHTRALRLNVAPAPGAMPWSLGFGQKAMQSVARDDALYLRVWMRSPDRVRVGLIFEQASEPYTKSLSQTVKLTPEWQEYRFVGYAKQAFAPGDAQLRFYVGYDKGTLEIAGVRFENYGKAPKQIFSETIDYWGGQAHSDAWRGPALERIEKLRKGDLKVRVVDAKGEPVAGAQVTIEQQRHAFHWGTAGPVARLLDTASPDNLRYQQEVKRLFNTFVFESDLKWPSAADPKKLEQVERGIEWLHANGIDHVRGHNLLWGSKKYMPAFTHDLPPDELRQACRDHVATVAGRLKGQVYIWDVVNEATDNVELWDKIGWQNFADAFKWTREADPTVQLCYNDYHALHADGRRQQEFERIQYLLDHGAPLDVLGEQAHIGTPLVPLDQILKRLDELAAFGKPIEITEFDLGVQDDAVHGQYVRDFLIAAFSHPAVHSFLQWGFWEGSHWRAADGGAMFRKDWSKRPAEDAYEDLVLKQWWTRATLPTNDAGRCATRAFYGTHLVTVEKAGKKAAAEVQLPPGQETPEVVMELE